MKVRIIDQNHEISTWFQENHRLGDPYLWHESGEGSHRGDSMRLFQLFLAGAILLVGVNPLAYAEENTPIEISRLTDRLYLLSTDQGSYTTNTIASVGAEGVLLVDTQAEADAEAAAHDRLQGKLCKQVEFTCYLSESFQHPKRRCDQFGQIPHLSAHVHAGWGWQHGRPVTAPWRGLERIRAHLEQPPTELGGCDRHRLAS